MKVKIVVGRSSLPAVGEVRDFEKSYALDLIDKGLAIMADGRKCEKVARGILYPIAPIFHVHVGPGCAG